MNDARKLGTLVAVTLALAFLGGCDKQAGTVTPTPSASSPASTPG